MRVRAHKNNTNTNTNNNSNNNYNKTNHNSAGAVCLAVSATSSSGSVRAACAPRRCHSRHNVVVMLVRGFIARHVGRAGLMMAWRARL
jgi:hypothetical protein